MGIDVTVISRAPCRVDFHLLPRRWVVKGFFAWISRARRLDRDFERLASMAITMVKIAHTRIMLRRLTKPSQPSPDI